MTEIEIFCHLPRFLAEIEHVLFAGNLICLFTLCSNSNLSSPSKLIDFCQIRRPFHMKISFLCTDVLTTYNTCKILPICFTFRFEHWPSLCYQETISLPCGQVQLSLGEKVFFLRFNAVPVLNGAFLAVDVTQRKMLFPKIVSEKRSWITLCF